MTDNRIMMRQLAAGLALAAMTLPTTAFADGGDRAQVAIAAAKAKIDTGDRIGTTGPAADVQVRARVALTSAQDRLKHHHEGLAFRIANQASALADLAMATAEYTTLTAQRDQLRVR